MSKAQTTLCLISLRFIRNFTTSVKLVRRAGSADSRCIVSFLSSPHRTRLEKKGKRLSRKTHGLASAFHGILISRKSIQWVWGSPQKDSNRVLLVFKIFGLCKYLFLVERDDQSDYGFTGNRSDALIARHVFQGWG